MKLKKIIAGVVAAASLSTVAAGALSASALNYTQPTDGYPAFLMFASSEWFWGNWGPNGYRKSEADDKGQTEGGFGRDAKITGDGTYTVSIVAPAVGEAGGDDYVSGKIIEGETGKLPENKNNNYLTDTEELQAAVGAAVFCVDIPNFIDGTEKYDKDTKTHVANTAASIVSQYDESVGAGPYKASAITVSNVKVAVDGDEIAVDQSKIVCGNIENDNYTYRIEIYNDYGPTKDDPPIDTDSIEAYESISVTFDIAGLSNATSDTTSGGVQNTTKSANTNKTASTSTTTSANTGASAGLAVGGIALAGVAVVLAKKRK